MVWYHADKEAVIGYLGGAVPPDFDASWSTYTSQTVPQLLVLEPNFGVPVIRASLGAGLEAFKPMAQATLGEAPDD